jgi:hypothetical protein
LAPDFSQASLRALWYRGSQPEDPAMKQHTTEEIEAVFKELEGGAVVQHFQLASQPVPPIPTVDLPRAPEGTDPALISIVVAPDTASL